LHAFLLTRFVSQVSEAATSTKCFGTSWAVLLCGAVRMPRTLPRASAWRSSLRATLRWRKHVAWALRWEVLASKLEEEQPDGVFCIQSALNDPAHAAMLVHEMQIVKQLADVCTKESDVAGEVRLETIRAQLISEGLPCASSNSFSTIATVRCRASREQATRICPASGGISSVVC